MPESSAIRIRPVGDVPIEAALRTHRRRIARLVPGAEIVHVGATAVPGALTKGDVDLMVRVSAPAFEAGQRALRSGYTVHQPENWTPTYASFVERVLASDESAASRRS
jgi:GrpB-like predicted nucleotidyltransferase (UPF0157 family)